MKRPKSFAERQLERDQAIQRQEQQLAGSGAHKSSIRSGDIPDQVERARPNKTFVIIGVTIIVLLIIAHFISAFSKKATQPAPTAPVEVEEVETE